MPAGFTGHCDHCGQEVSATYWGDAFVADDGTRIPLPHPAETEELRKLGYTQAQARRQGRYLRLHTRVCQSCEALAEDPEYLAPDDLPDRILQAIGLIAFGVPAGVMFWLGHSPWWAAPIGLALLAILIPAAVAFDRRRTAQRRPPRSQPTCPDCGGTIFSDLDPDRPIKCPLCKQGQVHWSETWIS